MFSLAGLLGSWRLIGAGLAVAAFLGLGTLAAVRGKEVKALEAEKATLVSRVETLGSALSEQNEAVKTLKKASDAQALAAAKAQEAAWKALGAANARVLALTHAPVPAECSGALEWLRSTVDQAETSRGAK